MPPPKRGSIKEAYSKYEPQGRVERQTSDPLTKRHERGYDPLDVAMREARGEYKRVSRQHDYKQTTPQRKEKARNVMRGLLHEHLVVMHEHGLVFEHTFLGDRLGFSIALAKYGEEGRVFVQVERTKRTCELYPDVLLPSDELIAINGDLIIDPSFSDFDAIRDKIASTRPVKLLFVKGELRKKAFEEQEIENGAVSTWFGGGGAGGTQSKAFDFGFFVCCAAEINDR